MSLIARDAVIKWVTIGIGRKLGRARLITDRESRVFVPSNCCEIASSSIRSDEHHQPIGAILRFRATLANRWHIPIIPSILRWFEVVAFMSLRGLQIAVTAPYRLAVVGL